MAGAVLASVSCAVATAALQPTPSHAVAVQVYGPFARPQVVHETDALPAVTAIGGPNATPPSANCTNGAAVVAVMSTTPETDDPLAGASAGAGLAIVRFTDDVAGLHPRLSHSAALHVCCPSASDHVCHTVVASRCGVPACTVATG